MANVEHFKMEVRKFETLEQEIQKISSIIKPHQDKLKDLKKQKNDLQTNICGFMQTNEIGECKLQEGALIYKETKNVVPLNKSAIKENILKFFKDQFKTEEVKKMSSEDLADALFTFVYESREYNEKTTLKRVQP